MRPEDFIPGLPGGLPEFVLNSPRYKAGMAALPPKPVQTPAQAALTARLTHAATCGDVAAVSSLLKFGATDPYYAAINAAAEARHQEVVKTLIIGLDYVPVPNNYYTYIGHPFPRAVMGEAIQSGDLDYVQWLLKYAFWGVPPGTTGREPFDRVFHGGDLAVSEAVFTGQIHVADYLLSLPNRWESNDGKGYVEYPPGRGWGASSRVTKYAEEELLKIAFSKDEPDVKRWYAARCLLRVVQDKPWREIWGMQELVDVILPKINERLGLANAASEKTEAKKEEAPPVKQGIFRKVLSALG